MLTNERERFSNTFLFSPTSTYITNLGDERGGERERERERGRERELIFTKNDRFL